MRNKLVGSLVAFALILGLLPTQPQRAAQAQSNGCYFVVRSFDAGLYYVGEYLTFKPTDAPQGYVVGAGGVCPVNAATPTPAPGQSSSPTATPTAVPSGSTPAPSPTASGSSGNSLALTGLSNLYYCGTPTNPILNGADLTYCPAAFVQLASGQATFPTSGFNSIPLVYPSGDHDYGNYLQIIAQTAHSFTVASFAFNAVGNPPPINTADNSVAKLIIFGTGTVANPNVSPSPTPTPTATPAPTATPTAAPTATPTAVPTATPTPTPTPAPTATPTPTPAPTFGPVTVSSQTTLPLTSGDVQTIQVSQSLNTTQSFTFTSTTSGVVSYSYTNGTLTLTAGNPGSTTFTIHSGVDSQTLALTITVVAGAISVSPLPIVVTAGGTAASASINQPDGGTLNTYTPSGFISANLVVTISNRTLMSISAPVGAAIGTQHVTLTSSDGGTFLFSVTVQAAPPLTVSPTSLPLIANTTQQLSAFQTGTSIFSASSDTPSIATVSAATFGTTVGIIAGSAAGSGNIIIGGADGLTKTVPFTVATPAPSSISLSPSTLSLVVGASTGNTSQIAQSGTGLTYTVASGGGYDPTIASVNISGATATVTALKAGTTVASIVSSDGTNTAPLTINVSNGTITQSPTGTLLLTLPTAGTLTLSQAHGTGNTYTAATNCSANYTISGTNPFTITPVAVGTCSTIFTANDGSTISVPVMVQYGNVTVNGGSAAAATVGAADVTVPITQTGLANGTYSVAGFSSSIASVTISGQNAIIHAVGAGTTTATVTNTASGRSGSLVINVAATPAVVASPTALAFYTGGAAQTATFSQATNPTPTFTMSATPNPALFSYSQSGGVFTFTPLGSVAGSTSATVLGIDGASKVLPLTLATPVPITYSPNPVPTIASGGTAVVNVAQGANTSLNTSSSNTAVFTVGAAFTNSGAVNLTGTTAGGSANLLVSSNVLGGGSQSIPINVATPTPAPTATPYPISAGTTTYSAQELTLKNAGPVALYPGKEASGTTMNDDSGNGLTGSYGTAVAHTTPANLVASSSVNYSPVYPSATATDAPVNYASVPTNTLLQPAIGTTGGIMEHARVTPAANPGSTQIMDYGQTGSNAPYNIVVNSTGQLQCVFRGFNSSSTAISISVVAPSADAMVVGSTYDVLCGTNGTVAWLAQNGQLVATTTETASTAIETSLNYTFQTSRGLTIGSTQGATATVTAPYSANFPGTISNVAVFAKYFAPPASSTDYSSIACSLQNAAMGYPAGTTCVQDGSGAPAGAAPAVTLQTSSSCSGSAVTSIALTYPTAQTFYICQTGYTTGYSVGTPAPVGVNAVIQNSNQLLLTPTTNTATTTSVTINGNGSVGLLLNIGMQTAYVKPKKLPYALAWFFTGAKGLN